MEELGSQDLTIVAAVIFLALVAFIAVLYLNSRSSGKAGGARTPNVKSSIPEGETGTVFVEGDGGKVVRRSTRQHKPVTPLGPKLAAAADADAETPKRAVRTPRASSNKTPTAADPVTPRSTRGRGRPPKSALA